MHRTGVSMTVKQNGTSVPVSSAARKGVKTGSLEWCMQRQLEISLSVLVFVLACNSLERPDYHLSTHYTPDPSLHLRRVFSRFLFLSFKKPGTDLYFKGRDDAYFIAFWVTLFWFLREASMRWILGPLAFNLGITNRRSIVRFAEQGWSLLYYSIFFSVGLYIMQNSPYRNLDTQHFYIGYPHDALPPLTKWYYLVQTAFVLQQIIVLNLEEKRKDYTQMFAHHIITTMLISFSYVMNWTRVGNATLCIMDFADILLPLAKLTLYTNNPKAADILFGIFMLAWIITRHVLFGIVLYSVVVELPIIVPHGWRPREGYFNSYWSHMTFQVLLFALQLIICAWFVMICRVAYNAVMGGGATDSRSEAGSSDEEDNLEEDVELDTEENVSHEHKKPKTLLDEKKEKKKEKKDDIGSVLKGSSTLAEKVNDRTTT